MRDPKTLVADVLASHEASPSFPLFSSREREIVLALMVQAIAAYDVERTEHSTRNGSASAYTTEDIREMYHTGHLVIFNGAADAALAVDAIKAGVGDWSETVYVRTEDNVVHEITESHFEYPNVFLHVRPFDRSGE